MTKLNGNQLLSQIKTLTVGVVNFAGDDKPRMAPIVGFITGKVEYLTAKVICRQVHLQQQYKDLSLRLYELIDKIPEDKEGVESLVQMVIDFDAVAYKSFSRGRCPFAIMARPIEADEPGHFFEITVIVAYASIIRIMGNNEIK